MALNDRQKELYKNVIRVWRDERTEDQADSGADFSSSGVAHISSLPCYFQASPEYDDKSVLGAFERPNQMNADVFHMEDGTDVKGLDIIEMLSGPSANAGECWRVQGSPRRFGRLANKQMVFAVNIERPKWLP